jgi:regulatory protein YycI of two-component signal transduction system YycFG
MNAYEVWKNTEGMSKNDRIDILYKNQILKYDGEVKSLEILIQNENLNQKNQQLKTNNISALKAELQKVRYNLTRVKNLLKNNCRLSDIPVVN